MSRTLTSAVEAALAGGNVPLLALVELDFAGGAVRVTNASYAFEWNGYTWAGLGRLGAIEEVKETAALEAQGVALRLSGVPSDMVAIALDEQYQGRDCRIWVAPLSESYQILTDPVLCFVGRMDNMRIEMGSTATITVAVESRLVDLERPRVRRYNDADQQAEYSGDLGFQYVEQMVEKQLIWGRA